MKPKICLFMGNWILEILRGSRMVGKVAFYVGPGFLNEFALLEFRQILYANIMREFLAIL
jgi:hypothetical protein